MLVGLYDELLDLKADGTFRLNMEFFNYATGLTMTNRRFDRIFGGAPRGVGTLLDGVLGTGIMCG